MNIVENIQALFINEAKASPLLLKDLASMEKYIAESYSGRSLIELLQNADDAGATNFYIEKISETNFLVANNGRPFNGEDLLSLCRSGASTKKRKSNTIGFRGIGFKSVVNYAQSIHLLSGDIKVSFSKELTQNRISDIDCTDSVPLIRVPHPFVGTQFTEQINNCLRNGYNTIFIFESKNTLLETEIQFFDADCMIFLNNVLNIKYRDNMRYLSWTSKRELVNHYQFVECYKDTEMTKWLLLKDNAGCSVAFKIDNEKAIKATKQEAVVHSFMPTKKFLSIPIKVNGDFSTDPSRTKVVIDDETKKAIENIGKILSEVVKKVFEIGNDKFGFVKIISLGKIDPLYMVRGESISDLILQETYKNITNQVLPFIKSTKENLYCQKIGMSEKDFYSIVNELDACGIGFDIEKNIPGIIDLLKQVGVKPVPTTLILDVINNIKAEKATRIQLVTDIIQESKLGIKSEVKNKIKKAEIFDFTDGSTKSIEKQQENDVIDEKYQGAICDNLQSIDEFKYFAKQLNISCSETMKNSLPKKQSIQSFESSIKTKRWRSNEENFTEFIKTFENVVEVNDVTNRNLGYDVETILSNNTHNYYEIKTVTSFNDPFSMTNNEFSSAVQYGENYFVAIMIQKTDSLEICLIKNPVKSLELTKRVVRWEWYCDTYKGEVYKLQLS